MLPLADFRDFFLNGELYPGFIRALKKLAMDKGEVLKLFHFNVDRSFPRASFVDCVPVVAAHVVMGN